MRRLVVLVALLAAGCGGNDEPPPDAADINRANDAREAVYLQRVLGDDPVSESVSLRVDGTAAVRRGGGRGYWDVAVELSERESERTLALVRGAPFAALAEGTITPGGFAGDDNERRYLMRRNGMSVTVTESDLPPRMGALVHDLNALIDGDLGHVVADDRHYSATGTTGSDSSDDDVEAPVIEDSPATPVERGGGPEPQRTLSCYGSGGRQAETASGLRAGPLVLEGLRPRSRRRVLPAPAVLEPGAAVTIVVAARDRGRAGLLYGAPWNGRRGLPATVDTLRLEGCSDSTSGGGPTRFDGGLVMARPGCTTLVVHVAGRGEPLRRRVGCG